MSTSWTGQIYVFQNERGQELAALSLPSDDSAWAPIRIYAVSGPRCPLAGQEPELVANATSWMAKLNRHGFAFVLRSYLLASETKT
jgi:hypothetical protein